MSRVLESAAHELDHGSVPLEAWVLFQRLKGRAASAEDVPDVIRGHRGGG